MEEQDRARRLAELQRQKDEIDKLIRELEVEKAQGTGTVFQTNIPYAEPFIQKYGTRDISQLGTVPREQLIEMQVFVNKRCNQVSADYSHTMGLVQEMQPLKSNGAFRELFVRKLIEQGRGQVSAHFESYKPLSYILAELSGGEMIYNYVNLMISQRDEAQSLRGIYAIYFGYLNLKGDVPECWFWMASVLNCAPNEITGYILEVFLIICGDMLREKCSRFIKIIRYIENYFIKEILNEPVRIRIQYILKSLKQPAGYMRLDSDGVWIINQEQLEILGAAEKLSNTHNYIPLPILKNKLHRKSDMSQQLRDLVARKFLTYKEKMYKLTISGHDCLAINTLRRRGLSAMGSPIGIGKESDIYYGEYKGKSVAIKVHRLGRTSFQRVEGRNLKDDRNWFTLNIENCRREVEFLRLFSDLSVPEIIDSERHMIVMELLDYIPLYKMKVENPTVIIELVFKFIKSLWELGWVHGDLNEFNIMVRDDDIKVVDFPQCIPRDDPRAVSYLKRDIECIYKFFKKKHMIECDYAPLQSVIAESGAI